MAFWASLKSVCPVLTTLLVASIVDTVMGVHDAPLATQDWLLLVSRPKREKGGRENEETEKENNYKWRVFLQQKYEYRITVLFRT